MTHPSTTHAVHADTALRAGPLVLDHGRHQVFLHGRPVPLTRLELALLRHLMENMHRVVTVDELVSCVIQGVHRPESSLVRVHMCHLRRKLGAAAVAITTVRGLGFWLDEQLLEEALPPTLRSVTLAPPPREAAAPAKQERDATGEQVAVRGRVTGMFTIPQTRAKR